MDMVQRLWESAYFPFFEGVIKRRSTARLYRESLRSQWWQPEQLRAQQLEKLNRLLEHARRTVAYWRDVAPVPERLETLEQLPDLPVLTKALIREHGNAMVSSDRSQAVWWKSTGGSTGEPLHFAHTPLSHEWRTAMSLRGYAWAGAPPGSRQAYIWGVPTQTRGRLGRVKEILHRAVERKRLFNSFAFTPETMLDCYRSLQRWKPQAVIGYTNATYEFARFVENRGLAPLQAGSVLCAAEKVHPLQRDAIARAFGAPVYDTYGSREFMLIASECEHRTGLHVSMENLIVEVVDDSGSPAAPGDVGRILVTDLHNYAMPFIRYEIGDLARVATAPCRCGRGLPTLADIVGRQLDVIRTPDGRVIPGELFPHVMKDFPEVRRFQVVQDALDDVRLLLQSDGELTEALVARIRDKLAELVGGGLDISVELVGEIPLTPSGKHRVTVSRLGD